MTWIADIIIGVLALMGTLGGAYFANRKSSALVIYRLQQLEQKVDKHNSVIERTFAGSLPEFLVSFLGSKKLSLEETERLKKLIDEHKEE